MEDYVGKICPVCKIELTEADKVKVCPDCGIPHHEKCWEMNEGCSTFGCVQQKAVEKTRTAEVEKCVKCGADLAEGYEFCPKCGTPKSKMKKRICGKCGAELAEGQDFCPKCGQKAGLSVDNNAVSPMANHNSYVTAKKGKKKIVIPVILAIVAVIAIGIGAFIAILNREKAIEDYMENASTFYSVVLSDAAKLENVGNDETSYWRAYIYDDKYSSIESAVLAAQIDNADTIDKLEFNYDRIVLLYKKLIDLPRNPSSELEELKDAVKDAYDAYVNFYDTVMNVSGSYKSFSESFSDTDDEMSRAIKKLGSLLD